MENIQKQDENALGVELIDYKKKCEKLLSTISKKDNAVKELEDKCSYGVSMELHKHSMEVP